MCITIEEVKKAVREVWESEHQNEMFRAIDQKFVAFLPTAIAKGISEAEKHMSMSKQTRAEFDKVYTILDEFRDTLRKNSEFHEEMRPILVSIKEDIDSKKALSNFSKKVIFVSKVVGSISVIIVSFVAGIKFLLK